MIKVVGIQHKSGSFENDDKKEIKYDNIVLHLVDDNQDGFDGVSGNVVDKLKISTNKFSDMFGGKITPETANTLVGNAIELVSAIRNGIPKVTGIRIVNSK